MEHKDDYNVWAYEIMDLIVSKMEKAFEMGRKEGRKEVFEKAEALLQIKDEDSG